MMNYPSAMRFACLLITALLIVQGAAALTFEQAPLNPAFVAYTEGADAGAVACYSAVYPSPGADPAPFATGLLPSPAVVYWPDGYTAPAVTDAAALPARFDLRDEGRVTPVRDQGKCGSCWAFATYGSLESTYLTDSGEETNFSENNMKNLCSDEYEDGFDYGPCDGGFAFMSDAYLVRGSGPVWEADDPYALPMPSNISPTDLSPVLDVREVTFLPQRTGPLDNDLFKEQLMQEGAIWVSFYVNWSCFADNYTTYYWPGDEEEYTINGGHAVTLVGWDDAFPKESFAVEPPGDGAFILKNSWGTKSGEDGYFYISYYDPIIGTFGKEGQEFVMDDRNRTSAGAVYTGVPADDERRIYQYDPLGWTTSAGTESEGPLYGANVFTADGYEALTDVSFYTRGPGAGYTVAIFTNFTTPPGDDAPVAWTAGTCTLPGYHTISLPEAVPLTPGEVFSVVLAIDDPSDTYPLVIEMPVDGYSSQATAGPGESYVSENWGETWEDVNDLLPNTNLCIKAFTHPLTVVPRDYATIQDAVNASASGDTIIVEAGTYPEEISINKTLTLLGMDGAVVATPADGTGIEIEAENVTVAGFMCDGGGSARYGIAAWWDNCTISDCQITGYENGLWLPSVQGLTLSDIASYDNDCNFMYENPDADPGNAIAETVTVNGRPVIYREGVTGETIDASTDAGAVICVNCTDMTIRDTATDAIGYGYYLCWCEDILLDTVTADDVEIGLGVLHSANVTVQDSIFGPDTMEGMLLLDNNGLFVDENEIACSGDGIFSMIIENFTISDNTITARDTAMEGWMCVNGSVTGNSINGNPDTGMEILLAQDISLQNNTVDASSEGISALYFWDSLVSGNTVRCNDTGIGLLVLGYGSEISENTVDNCSVQAIMELNNSSVSGNRFSGGAYPVIEASDGGGAVYVYRNDFVLTETVPDGDILSATAAAEMPATAAMDAAAAFSVSGYSIEDVLPGEWDKTGQFSAMAAATDVPVIAQQADAANVTWHSPAPVTYWYGVQKCNETMGNYWSTYTGTDTTHDGIGDTPFVYLNETKDWYPLVNTIASYSLTEPQLPDGDDPAGDIAVAGTLSTGESATLRFTGSPVQTVTLTATETTGKVVLTVDRAPTGPAGLTGPVYSYLSAQLSGMTDGEVGGAAISFRVPAAWLRAEGLEPADISLFRFHDGAWQELPTSVVSEEGGWVSFEAITPGFSTFAIAEGGTLNATIDAIPDMMGPGPEIINDTADDAGSFATEPDGETAPEPQVTVAVPDATDAATPQASPAGALPLLAGAAGAALLLRRR
ncbi:lectin like domain-containing protein [Methanogenium organophilum]|uniref:Lectin like domain-containing protein n=1 Tax=Methanogenium organophilum TaxID=2199 RepID=A0A9X9T8B8_METOG|nr:lectin like domain-containing protein [Methanogenium organophilum]WAI02273.1 lectin like domain-containing protein [Methanogenium organophilum]